MKRLLDKAYSSIRNLVSRGVAKSFNDGQKWQTAQVALLDGELVDGAERAQNYGLTSLPHEGAEVIVVHVGADRSHPVILACDDRRYRVQGLTSGEVCLYTDEGDKIHFKRGKIIEITTDTLIINAKTAVKINTAELVSTASNSTSFLTPALNMGGLGGGNSTANLQGGLMATEDIKAGQISLQGHTHGGVETGNSSTNQPLGG